MHTKPACPEPQARETIHPLRAQQPKSRIDKNVWTPYHLPMKKNGTKNTVELRIQKSMLKTLGHEAAHGPRSAPISHALLGIVTSFQEIERQCSKFGTDVDIHMAEIHTIMAIHNNEGIHVGGLAESLGVTKGSVSELLRRLERKGLAYKEKDPLKMTRLNVYLTEKGKAANSRHMGFHSQLDNMVDEAMSTRSPEEITSIVGFLTEMLDRLNAVELKDD